MLLDPFEEEFHLPAALVERADGQRWKRGVVGKKHQAPAFWVCVAYPSEPFEIGLLSRKPQARPVGRTSGRCFDPPDWNRRNGTWSWTWLGLQKKLPA